jgi:hypothetical protein
MLAEMGRSASDSFEGRRRNGRKSRLRPYYVRPCLQKCKKSPRTTPREQWQGASTITLILSKAHKPFAITVVTSMTVTPVSKILSEDRIGFVKEDDSKLRPLKRREYKQ